MTIFTKFITASKQMIKARSSESSTKIRTRQLVFILYSNAVFDLTNSLTKVNHSADSAVRVLNIFVYF